MGNQKVLSVCLKEASLLIEKFEKREELSDLEYKQLMEYIIEIGIIFDSIANS